jgi:hypothetical protein
MRLYAADRRQPVRDPVEHNPAESTNTNMTTNLTIDHEAAAIIEHHNRAIAHGSSCRDHIIETGRLLWEKKCSLPHGQWIPWIERNLPFGRRMASKYIERYKELEALKWESSSHLTLEPPASAGPMTRQEADETVAEIRQHLEDANAEFAEAAAAIECFREIRDRKAYAPEFGTFEAYLTAISIDPDWFRAQDELYDAFHEWSNTGSPDRLLYLLKSKTNIPERAAQTNQYP